MSTIASPRNSVTISSQRDSIDTTRSASRTRTPIPPQGSLRRNRAALRNYYGLKDTAASETSSQAPSTPIEAERESELDRDGFDPAKYVKDLLAKESVEGILRTEAGLVSEIRSLDGEKKALVYDNYSKLIAATETIRKMRTNMDPLTPTTSMLSPAITHIAETATMLSDSLRSQHGDATSLNAEVARNLAQKQTVRWVLDAPERLGKLVAEDRKDDAKEDWTRVSAILDQWKGVRGVDAVRDACQKTLASGET